jgi:hypothetical protein
MKILGFYLPNAVIERLFGDEKLETLRHLMTIGCYGFVEAKEPRTPEWMILARRETDGDVLTLGDYLVEAGKRCKYFGSSMEPLIQRSIDRKVWLPELDHFEALKTTVSTSEWDYCQVFISPDSFDALNREDYLRFDQELGDVLGALNEDVLIFIVAQFTEGEKPGCLIMAAPQCPLLGEYEGGFFIDIAPTVLELAGYPLPGSALGKSWISGKTLGGSTSSGLTEDEEAILRERLSGLGYI